MLRVKILEKGYSEGYFEILYDFQYINILDAGTEAHKAKRWEIYQAGGGEWGQVRWSNVYDSNMEQASRAKDAVIAYHSTLGWGTPVQAKLTTDFGDRYLDIRDDSLGRGIEYKLGYVYRDPFVLLEADKDGFLVTRGWQIEWVIEDKISLPMKTYLESKGIKVTILGNLISEE